MRLGSREEWLSILSRAEREGDARMIVRAHAVLDIIRGSETHLLRGVVWTGGDPLAHYWDELWRTYRETW